MTSYPLPQLPLQLYINTHRREEGVVEGTCEKIENGLTEAGISLAASEAPRVSSVGAISILSRDYYLLEEAQ